MIESLGPQLRAEFEQLKRSEAKIVRALTRPEVAEVFSRDPVAALEKIGVAVPPIIKQRLKAAAGTGAGTSLLGPLSFRMPDGEVITARVSVHFTEGSKAR